MKKSWKERALYHYAVPVPKMVDEDPSYEPQGVAGAAGTVETFPVSQRVVEQPPTWDRTDALLSELLRVLHLLRGDVAEMNETLKRIREEAAAESTQTPNPDAFPAQALQHGVPR